MSIIRAIVLGFASLNRTFCLSPHENICTIELIAIHYFYSIVQFHGTIKR